MKRSLRYFGLLLCAALLCVLLPRLTMTARAVTWSGYCGGEGDGRNLIWAMDLDNSVLTIEGTGEMANWPSNKAPWSSYSIKTVILSEGVTSIGSYAFQDQTSLVYATIPDSVTRIGKYAFSSCTGLTSLTLPSGLEFLGAYAFSDCTGITSIVLPEGLTALNDFVFSGCTGLIQISIPDTMTSLSGNAFSRCTSLTSIWVGPDNPAYCCYDGVVFSKDGQTLVLYPKRNGTRYEIPDGTVSVGDYAFYGQSALSEITLPSSLVSIGKYAFACCSALSEITIPSSLSSIGNYAFYDCSALSGVYISDLSAWCRISYPSSFNTDSSPLYHATNLYLNGSLITDLVIPEDVSVIGDGAFARCLCLTSVTIPDSVTSIGTYAFSACSSITSIVIPDSVTSMGARAFFSCSKLVSVEIGNGLTDIPSNAFSNCKALKNLTLGSNVASIGSFSFGYCTALYTVVIPDSVTSLGGGCFYACTALKNLTLGSGLVDIGGQSFYYCQALGSVTIPDSVTTIGHAAFENAGASQSVMTIGTGITTIGSSAFSGSRFSFGTLVLPDCLTEIGASAFSSCRMTSVFIPDNVTEIKPHTFEKGNIPTVSGMNGVTTIGEYAFSECRLSNITIPENVVSIGKYAFYKTRIENLTIPGSVEKIGEFAFAGDSDLTWATMKSGVRSIGKSAFSGCNNLRYVTIPDTVVHIGQSAFANTNAYTTVGSTDWENGCLYIGHWLLRGSEGNGLTENVQIRSGTIGIAGGAFENQATITSICLPDSVVSVCDYAFSGCTALSSVSLNSSLMYLDEGAFKGCTALTEINIPSGITEVSDTLFRGCSSLIDVNLPDGLTKIGAYSFAYCSSLQTLSFPSGLTEIGMDAFSYCKKLAAVSIPDAVTRIGEHAFYSCRQLDITIGSGVTEIGKYAFAYCGMQEIVLPDNVTTIGDHAFYSCTSLCRLQVGSCLQTIGDYAFAEDAKLTELWVDMPVMERMFGDLTELTTLVLGDRVQEIGVGAFQNFGALADVTIPSGVTAIDSYAFSGCGALLTLMIPDSVTNIMAHAFEDSENLTLQCSCCNVFVPAYASANGIPVELIHAWGEPEYNWSEDNRTVSASCVCLREETHTATETVQTTGEITKPATCTEGGETTYTAVFENPVFEPQSRTIQDIAPTSHDWADPAYSWSADHLTVTASRSCRNDSNHVESETVETTWEITKPASCTEAGETTYTAEFENPAFTVQFLVVSSPGPTGHDWGEPGYEWSEDNRSVTACRICRNDSTHVETETVNTSTHSVFPTCTENGSDTFTAVFQNPAFPEQSRTIIVPALGHDWNEPTYKWSSDNAAVTATRTCKRNSQHKEMETVSTSFEITLEPTIYASGTGVYTAVFEAEVFETQTKTVEIPKLIGGNCGAQGDNLTWELNQSTGKLTIRGSGDMSDSGNFWTDYRLQIKTVSFPEGMTRIGNSAFRSCTALTDFTIPKSVTRIGSRAFEGCTKLSSVTIPDNVASLGDYAFLNCSGLRRIDLGAGLVNSFSEVSFSGCEVLEYVRFNMLQVGSWFVDNQTVTAVEFGPRVKFISAPFQHTSTLTEIRVDPENETFCSIDGVLFSKDRKLLVRCPGGKAGFYAIPVFVEKLQTSAFSGCSDLTGISIPNSIRTITMYAFSDCTGLVEVNLPDAVYEIEYGAFNGCSNLEKLTAFHAGCSVQPAWTSNGRQYDKYTLGVPGQTVIHGYTSESSESLKWFADRYGYAFVPLEGHTHSYTKVQIDAGCTMPGCSYFICSCGSYYGVETIPATGHSVSGWSRAAEPTCTQTGLEEGTCSRCGFTVHQEIPALGHSYVNGVCSRCGMWDPALNPFGDVKEGKYYYDAVLWAISQTPPITNGTDDTHFSPNKTCTRGQVVTFLWNAMGQPEPDPDDNPFVDVKPGKYYTKAVLWAYQTGVTNGTDDTHFKPGGDCTRGQVVTFLWKALGSPEPESDDNPFTDVKAGKYYYKPVLWAVENGVTKGTTATTFSPNKTCTRGQVVTFLYNALAK